MRKSFFLMIALVLLVSGAAYAATITTTMSVTIPSYLYMDFNGTVAEMADIKSSTITWPAPTGAPAPGSIAESNIYELKVLSTGKWNLTVEAPAVLSDGVAGTTDPALSWKFGQNGDLSDITDYSAAGAVLTNNEPTGAAGFVRYMSFAIPFTWDVAAGTYSGDVKFIATLQ